jgi:hypothetical protein
MSSIRPLSPVPSRALLSLLLTAAWCFGAEARVRLRARDGDTGRTLAGVQVSVGQSVFVTGADGECVVPAVVGGRLILTVSLEGSYTATDTIVVSTADVRSVLKLYGTRPRTAIGFVKDGSTGRRLAGATVKVRGEAATARTDSTGMYAMPFP